MATDRSLALALVVAAVVACGKPSGPPAPGATGGSIEPAASGDGGADAGAKKTRLVLHADRALVPRTGAIVAPAWVEIEGGEIRRVGSEPPADAASARHLGDATILPGLIDAHSHLLHLEKADDGGSMVAEAVTMTDADRALRGVTFAKQMLLAGFTTVRDLGNSGRSGDVALKRAIDKGWVTGPTMLVSTRALAPPGGQFPRMGPTFGALVEQEYAVVRSADEGRAAVRQAFYEGADLIKIIVDHGPGRTMTADEVRAIVDVAHAAKKKVAAHVLTPEAADVAVTAGVDSCDHGYDISDATLSMMSTKRIFLVPTDYRMDFYERFVPAGPKHDAVLAHMKKFRERAVARLALAHKLRVPIAAGSDAYIDTGRDDRGRDAAEIFAAYAEAGLSPLEIVQTATSNAADLLGLPAKTTALEPGSPADVIAVRGNPTKDVAALTRVTLVVKRGRVVER